MKQLINFSTTAFSLIIAALLVFSCSSGNCPEDMYGYLVDEEVLKEYHAHYFPKAQEQVISDNFAIYLDYSSSMKTAFDDEQTAKFYKQFINALKISKVDFYEVDKNEVTKIDNLDKSELYQKIKDASKFSGINAPLDKAVSQIVNDNKEAVLITDGELWDNGERNDPWAREAFETWLSNGNTIDFYVTDHLDKGKQKHVFYMFFIPKSRVADEHNISQEFKYYLDNHVEAQALNYSHFSFSNNAYKLVQEYPSAQKGGVNENAALNEQTYLNAGNDMRFEYHEYFLNWADMMNYIFFAYNEKGEQVEGGDPLISKLFLESGTLEFYTIEALEIRVYDIKDDFYSFIETIRCRNGAKPEYETDESGEKILDEDNNPILRSTGEPGCYDENGELVVDTAFTPSPGLPVTNELFTFDNEAFQNNYNAEGRGEIIVKIHPNFNGSQINAECGNLHRIDLVMSGVTPNTSNPNLEKFIWEGKQVEKNTSIYDSILGALNAANPKEKVIYTFYIKTLPNDYMP